MKKESSKFWRVLSCLFLCFWLLPKAPVFATDLSHLVTDGVLTITVTSPREFFYNYYPEDIAATGATKLKIVGPLENTDDFARLRAVINTTLSQIDLSEAVLPDNTLQAEAFYNVSALTAIALPANLTTIKYQAFYGCSALTTVSLPASLTSIEYYTFYNCTSLASLTINVTGALNLDGSVFYGCTQLAAVSITAGGDVTLGNTSNGIFNSCSALQTFELHTPGKLMAPASNQFYMDSSGGSLTTVTLDAQGAGSTLGERAFRNCKLLTNVTLPAGLTAIPINCFYNCDVLSSVAIPASVTSIGNYAFYHCIALGSLDLSATQIDAIGNYAFQKCSALTTINLPASLTNIGNSAFSNCSSLTSLTINVTGALSIGYSAMSSCTNLTDISIIAGGDVTLGTSASSSSIIGSSKALQTFELHTPGKLTAPLNNLFDMGTSGGALTTVTLDAQGAGSTLGQKAFYNCKLLTSVTLPASLTAIPNYCFYYCEALPSVAIPASVTSIGTYAFDHCIALGSLDLSATQVSTIGNYAFQNCSALASVSLPAGITSLGNNAFYNCTSLGSMNLSQAQIASIPNSAFSNCTSLTSVQLPATISSIGQSAFYSCGLTTLECTTNQPLTIGSSAFYSCKSLTDVSLTAGVGMTFESSAFGNCTSLQNVTLNAEGDVTFGTSNFDSGSLEVFELSTPGKVTLPSNMFYKYPTNSLRRAWLNAHGEGSTIGDYAFQYSTHLEELLLPAGLTTLGQSVFNDCSSLTSITLPATTTIANGYNMFNNCTALQTADLSKTQLTAVGDNAFYGCTSLTSVSLPEGFKTISSSMFNGCKELTTINLPADLETIGENAFYGCKKLPSITVPASVTTFGSQVFYGCSALTTASILANVATLPQQSFYQCSALQTVTLGNSIKTIGERAFYDCSQLREITLPSQLTTINQYAFYNCSALTMISLPSTLTTLGDDAFYKCSGLITLEIPEGVSTLPTSVFYDCTGLQSLYLPSTITEINYSALYNLDNLVDLHIMATTPPPFSYFSRASEVTLYVPETSIAAYQAAEYWQDFKAIYAELTDLATLDDGEFALLQQIYAKARGNSWTRQWTLGETKATTAMPFGVKVSDGHVRQIVLVNNGLGGNLPVELLQFPQAWYVNVSQNAFIDDIGEFFDEKMTTPNTALTYLDLSDNQLYGNIGKIGNAASETTEKLPNLTTLKIARNQIRDVKPVLPAHITSLDLSGQEVDFNHTFNFSDFVDASIESLPNYFPSILSYRHDYKDYGNVHYLLWAPDATEPWTVLLYKNSGYTNSSIFNYSASGWNFLPSGSEIYLTNNHSNAAARNRIRLVFDFQQGDINYNFDLDVSDLQTLINFAVHPEGFPQYSPFNWAAANNIAADPGDDEVINIQDVVAEVNLLLDDDLNPTLAPRKEGRRAAKTTAEDAEALLTIEDGQLVLTSERPVAALDIRLSGNVQWSSEMSLFSHKSRGSRTIFYSLLGDVLPAGRTVLGTVSNRIADLNDITVSLSDADGYLIPVAIGCTPTGVHSVHSDTATVPTVYDLQGRQVTKPAKGLYFVNGRKVLVK